MNAINRLSTVGVSCQLLLCQFSLIVLGAQVAVTIAYGTEYYISADGSDSNPGTDEQPFQSVSHAAQVMQPGDTCWIRGGVYRETIQLTGLGWKGKPIIFARYQNELVIIDGSDLVPGPWTVGDHGIWKAKIFGQRLIEAVFCDGRMMVEARWPNCSWEETWNAEQKWALSGKGSKLGAIECPDDPPHQTRYEDRFPSQKENHGTVLFCNVYLHRDLRRSASISRGRTAQSAELDLDYGR